METQLVTWLVCCLVLGRQCPVGLTEKIALCCCSVIHIFWFVLVCFTVTCEGSPQLRVNCMRLGWEQTHNRMSIECINLTTATQQPHKHSFCLLYQDHNKVQGLPSPPNQTLLFIRPWWLKRDKPKISQPDSLHSYWEQSLRNYNTTESGQTLAVIDTSRLFRRKTRDPHRNAERQGRRHQARQMLRK